MLLLRTTRNSFLVDNIEKIRVRFAETLVFEKAYSKKQLLHILKECYTYYQIDEIVKEEDLSILIELKKYNNSEFYTIVSMVNMETYAEPVIDIPKRVFLKHKPFVLY